MTHGGDHISIDQLIKIYKLKINPETNMIIFNDKLRYKDILQEALYIWYMLRVIKIDPFVRNYYGDMSKLNIIRQETIEADILPTNSNFKFDLGFPNINILVEVNEYPHEQPEKIIQDNIKNSLAILCGYISITLKVKDVFNMDEKSYNKLSDIEIHDKLAESDHLKTFSKKFINQITAALLEFKDVRDNYIMVLFKQMLKTRIITIVKRIENNISASLSIYNLINNSNYTNKDLYYYNNLDRLIKSDNVLLRNTEDDLTIINSATDFIDMFNLKHRCILSKNPKIITFSDIVKLLKIEQNNISEFKIFLCLNIVNINLKTKSSNIKITWEELSEVIYNYDSNSKLSKILRLYYRESGRSYEIIIQLIKSHTNALKTNRDILTTYTNYVNDKNLDIINNLKIKTAVNVDEKNKIALETNKIIEKLKKNLYDATKHENFSDLQIETIELNDDIVIDMSSLVKYVECDSVKEIMLKFKKNLVIVDESMNYDENTDNDSDAETASVISDDE